MSPRTEIVILDVWLIVGFCVYIVLWGFFWISIECEPTRRCIGKVEHIGPCGYKARWLDPTFDTYCSVTMIVGDEHANAATPRSDFLYSVGFSLPESQKKNYAVNSIHHLAACRDDGWCTKRDIYMCKCINWASLALLLLQMSCFFATMLCLHCLDFTIIRIRE